MKGRDLIAAERQRQITEEGFDAQHDAEHTSAILERAAMCYLVADDSNAPQDPCWPWDSVWWKPKDRQSNLIKAGALYLAAADRVAKDSLRIYNLEISRLRQEAEACAILIDRLVGP